MGLLNRFFRSTEETAKQLVEDETAMINIWKDYLASTKEKGELIDALQPQNLQNILQRLKSVISSELVKISYEEKTEEELLKNLTAIEHEKNIKRVQKLEYCLAYTETKYKYIYHLLEELLNIIKQELHLAENLSKGTKHEAMFIAKMKECWLLEQNILAQIEKIKTFHKLFTELLKGEQVIQQLSKKEKRIISLMDKKMSRPKGLIYDWAQAVTKSIEAKVHEAVADFLLEKSQYADFEFVNRPEFVDLVRATAQALRIKKKEISEETIIVFVHIFREAYNDREGPL